MLYSAFGALNDWTSALDQGFSTDVIYFDFSKAFDTVTHDRLFNKLRGYGVDGKLLECMVQILSYRQVFRLMDPYLHGREQKMESHRDLFLVPSCLPCI